MSQATYEAAKAAYFTRKNEVSEMLRQIDNRRRFRIPQGSYTDVQEVTICGTILVLHHKDESFTPLAATVGEDGDPDFVLHGPLDIEMAVQHGLLDARFRDEVNYLRAEFDRRNEALGEWTAFRLLAQKFGLLVPENTVEV